MVLISEISQISKFQAFLKPRMDSENETFLEWRSVVLNLIVILINIINELVVIDHCGMMALYASQIQRR